MLLVKLIEPPYTERYVRWCERSEFLIYEKFLLLDCLIKISTHHLTWLTISEKISYERDERPFGAIPIDGKLIAVVFRLIA